MSEGVFSGLLQRLHDVTGRGQVRVSHSQRDYVHAIGALGLDPSVELREQIGRKVLDPSSEPHRCRPFEAEASQASSTSAS